MLLAALAAERARELAVSRANESRRPGRRSAARTYPLMLAVHAALFVVPPLEAARRPARRPSFGWVLVLLAATGLRLWSIRSLGTSWNVRAAVAPDLDPVVAGPYAYVRHPNYLAVVLEFAAVPLLAGAWVSAAVLSAVNAAVLLDRIRAEERLLDASPAYRRAFAGRKRFIPGVF